MNWLKAVGYGVILFAVLFVVASILIFGLGFKMGEMPLSITMLVAAAAVIYLLAQQYKIGSLNEGIQVGLTWLVVDALLEYIVIVQILNKGSFSFYTWSVILGYTLALVVPIYVGGTAKK